MSVIDYCKQHQQSIFVSVVKTDSREGAELEMASSFSCHLNALQSSRSNYISDIRVINRDSSVTSNPKKIRTAEHSDEKTRKEH